MQDVYVGNHLGTPQHLPVNPEHPEHAMTLDAVREMAYPPGN